MSLIKQCNCVVQFSAVCPKYDSKERGASTYEERVAAMAQIAPHKRVIMRMQPYHPAVFLDVLREIPRLRKIGVYGLTIEGMKYVTRPKNTETVKVGADYCFHVNVLRKHFAAIKDACHNNGLRFFCAENRLRNMGDDLCCCGVEGMGWQTNTANLNHLIYDPDGYKPTAGQLSRPLYLYIGKATIGSKYSMSRTYDEVMRMLRKTTLADVLKPL